MAGSPRSVPPVPVSQRRRAPRLSPDELARRMYAAAREILFAQGITVTLEDLSLDDVIALARVPRSSVYRRWPYKGDFVADLLVNLAGPDWMAEASFDQQTLATAAGVLLENWDVLATAEGRRGALVELIRVAVTQNFIDLVKSSQWYVFYTLCVTARPPQPEIDDANRAKVVAAVHAAAQAFIDMMADFYSMVAAVMGLRPRPPYSMRHVVAAATAAVEGLAVNQLVALANQGPGPAGWSLSEVVSAPMRHPDGYPGEWSLPALTYLAILDAMQEPDPTWEFRDELRAQLLAAIGASEPS